MYFEIIFFILDNVADSTSRPVPAAPINARPPPINCKKKKGTCSHIVAFGLHYNKSAWTAYETYLSGQHAITPLPDDS